MVHKMRFLVVSCQLSVCLAVRVKRVCGAATTNWTATSKLTDNDLAQANSLCYKEAQETNSLCYIWHNLKGYATKMSIYFVDSLSYGKIDKIVPVKLCIIVVRAGVNVGDHGDLCRYRVHRLLPRVKSSVRALLVQSVSKCLSCCPNDTRLSWRHHRGLFL